MLKQNITAKFQLPAKATIQYRSYQDQLANFVMKDQLLNPHLWERFVAQFVEQIDGTNNGWRGEYFGKMLRGACLTWQYTHSMPLYSTIRNAVIAMMNVQEKDGRISSFSRDTEFGAWDLWCRKYVMLGMEYFYDICDNARLKKRIEHSLTRQADYIMRYVGPAEEGKKEILTCTNFWKGLNSASILEPFVRLYRLTGEEEYRKFAEYIISTGFCEDANLIDLVNLGIEPYRFPQTKAYEMMSCFEGLLEYAVLMGREDYVKTVCDFADLIKQSDVTIIGSCGCTHELFDHSIEKQTQYSEMIMLETCVTVTWMKLCFRLLQITGDSKYADWIEESSLNAMSGAVNDFENRANQALTFDSYSPLVTNTRARLTGGKQMIGDGEYYGCCACIGSAGTAISNLYGFLSAQDGYVINLYHKATIRFVTPNQQNLRIHVLSDLPEKSRVKIRVYLSEPENFAFYFRIPAWSKKASYRIGNGPVMKAECGTYLRIEREWNKGDTVELRFDVMARSVERNGKTAFVKAGYVLARDRRHGEDYGEAIAYKPTRSAKIRLQRVEPTIRAQMQYKLTLKDGKTISLIDYSSAGKNWDDAIHGVHVWMDTTFVDG